MCSEICMTGVAFLPIASFASFEGCFMKLPYMALYRKVLVFRANMTQMTHFCRQGQAKQ